MHYNDFLEKVRPSVDNPGQEDYNFNVYNFINA